MTTEHDKEQVADRSAHTGTTDASAKPDGTGVQKLRFQLQHGAPPEEVAKTVAAYPAERDAMMTLLHQTVGNSYVRRVIDASQSTENPKRKQPQDLGNYDSAVGRQVTRLRALNDKEFLAHRSELQGKLSDARVDPAVRAALLQEYEATEWIAHERHLALPKEPEEEAFHQAYVGGEPIKFWVPEDAPRMRAMFEREFAAGKSYKDVMARVRLKIGMAPSGTQAEKNAKNTGYREITLMDQDAAAFRTEFRKIAHDTAIAMLDDSSRAIDRTLSDYGIAHGKERLTLAAHRVAKDPDALESEVDNWMIQTEKGDDNHKAFTGDRDARESLAHDAERLRAIQANIDALVQEQLRLSKLVNPGQHAEVHRPAQGTDPTFIRDVALSGQKPSTSAPNSAKANFDRQTPPSRGTPEEQLVAIQAALPMRREEFRLAWLEAERAHPILATYREGSPDGHKLAGLSGSDHDVTRSVIHQVLPKLANIYRTKAALLGEWGSLDPLRLAPAVEIAKQQAFVASGSYRECIVHDMVESAHDSGGLVHWAFEAIMLALTALTLIPSGGTSAMGALAVTGLAYDVYAGVGEYEDFKVMSAASNTDLDKIHSISDQEPSLTPLLMRMVSAGLNLTMAASLFKRAASLRRAAATGHVDKNLIDELNKAGEAAGVKGVGDEAAHAPSTSPAPTQHPPTEGNSPTTTTHQPQPTTATQHGPPQPTPAPTAPPPRVSSQAAAEDARNAAIDDVLRGEGHRVEPNPLEGVDGAGRQGDRLVDGVKTEYKTLDPGADSGRIRNVVNSSVRTGGQARHMVINARGSGLTRDEALRGIARAMGVSRDRIDSIRIIGDDFSVTNGDLR